MTWADNQPYWMSDMSDIAELGIIYSGRPIEVTPDADGRFEIYLPPSSALGRYVVRMGDYTFSVAVPDDAQAVLLDEIAVPE